MKALADYFHSKGLKFGIYGDVGPKTCAGYPSQNGNGSGYFTIDAQTFADWGVDSFKFDGCNEDPHNFDKLYPIMRDALNKTGRKILFSCEWPFYQNVHNPPINVDYDAVAKTCNLYRNFDDVNFSWNSIRSVIDVYGNNQDKISKYNGPGNWLDPDELVVGNNGLSWDQSRTHFAMWAMWSSPLYMSNDLRSLAPQFKKILQNKKIIAVNQDKHGVFAKRIYIESYFDVWVKPVEPIVKDVHSYAIVYLYKFEMGDAVKFSFPLSKLLPDVKSNVTFAVEDLYEDEKSIPDVNMNQNLELAVNPSGSVRMVKLVPK